jgi:hypothetical protein
MLRPTQWQVSLDRYLNPFLLPPPTRLLPGSIQRFLERHKNSRPQLGNVALGCWAFVGALASLSLISIIDRQVPVFESAGSPLIIGSFVSPLPPPPPAHHLPTLFFSEPNQVSAMAPAWHGIVVVVVLQKPGRRLTTTNISQQGAAAVLEFYAIDSPLSQPRNALFGQVIGSVVAVATNTAFSKLPVERYQELRWLAGALSCSISIFLMVLTGTVHPPAGATALLGVTADEVARVGWLLVPMVVLGSAVMFVVAFLVNNVQRRFPLYWWTPEEVGSFWGASQRRCRDCAGEEGTDLEAAKDHGHGGRPGIDGSASADREPWRTASRGGDSPGVRLIVTRHGIMVPPGLELEPEERLWLESLSNRL